MYHLTLILIFLFLTLIVYFLTEYPNYLVQSYRLSISKQFKEQNKTAKKKRYLGVLKSDCSPKYQKYTGKVYVMVSEFNTCFESGSGKLLKL